MLRTTVLERGRIERDPEGGLSGTPWRRKIPATLFDRLLRLEGNREDQGRDPIFTWGRNRATVGPWVGVLQIPGLQLEILPKTDDSEVTDGATDPAGPAATSVDIRQVRANLLEMLSYGGVSKVRSRGSATVATRKGTLHDQLVAQFLDRALEELLRGTDRRYGAVDENLGTVRGKLLVGRQVARNAGKKHKFWCRFDLLNEDTRINSTLRRACDALSDRGLPIAVQQRLAQVLALLADVEPSSRDDAEAVFTRQNIRFQDVYIFARMVLEGETPDVKRGQTSTYSLLFDMDKVFERYVSAFLAKHVLPRFNGAVVLDAQARLHSEALFHRVGARRGTLHMEPDLHFTWVDALGKPLLDDRGRPRTLIADTKWKRLDPGPARPKNNDLYQLYAYVHRYPCKRAYLLYPHAVGAKPADFDALHDHYGLAAPKDVAARRVSVRFLELHHDLGSRAERERLADQLEGLIREGFGMEARPAGPVHTNLPNPHTGDPHVSL